MRCEGTVFDDRCSAGLRPSDTEPYYTLHRTVRYVSVQGVGVCCGSGVAHCESAISDRAIFGTLTVNQFG
jgi:hypothetical protein